METIARKGTAKVIWNGVNVTDDIWPYVSSVEYTDHEEGASDEVVIVLENTSGVWASDWDPTEGDTIQLYIGYKGEDLMDTGLFQIDEVTASGPPDVFEIKCISSFISKTLRTKNNKAFEAQTLRQIAKYFCTKHGFTLVDETSNMLSQISLDRKTQEGKTDLQFLSELAQEYGFLFSVKGKKLVFTSYYNLDNADSIKTLSKWQIGNYSINRKTFDTYASGLFSARDAKKGKVNTMRNNYENWLNENVVEDILVTTGRAENKQQAEQKVKGGLWRKNRYKQAGNLNDLPGDPSLVAGMNFDLIGLYNYSGQYHITTSVHHINGDGGYLTSIEIRRTGTMLKPRRVPPTKKEKDTYDSETTDAEENDYLSDESDTMSTN